MTSPATSTSHAGQPCWFLTTQGLTLAPVVNIPPLFLGHPIPNPNIGQGTLLGAPASSPAAVVIRGGQLLARLARQRCAEKRNS